MAYRATGPAGAELFEHQRKRLFGIAYGMLGSVMDAEDVVQDAYLRWTGIDPASIDSPAAYLTTITTRLAIDRLRSAQRRRETYVGDWLPEPLVTEYDADPATIVAEAERLSLAMLTAMERLNPTERAVLLLREVFDLNYADIADIVDKSPTNCRQIVTRARQHIGDPAPVRPPDPEIELPLMTGYLEAMAMGDVDLLAKVFADDVILWSDGGGEVRAARHSISGAWRVARHLVGVAPQTPTATEVRVIRVNGAPAFGGWLDGRCLGVVAFDISEGVIVGVRAMINPEKLRHVAAS